MAHLLVAVLFFIIGYISRKEPPVTVAAAPVVEKCNPSPIQVNCPKHDDTSLRNNLYLCINTIQSMAGKMQESSEELADCRQQIQTEKDETEYWKRRYTDFDCD